MKSRTICGPWELFTSMRPVLGIDLRYPIFSTPALVKHSSCIGQSFLIYRRTPTRWLACNVIGEHLQFCWAPSRWLALAIVVMLSANWTYNCSNVIGDSSQCYRRASSRLALAHVAMLSASSFTVTGLCKCGNVIGELLHGDGLGL